MPEKSRNLRSRPPSDQIDAANPTDPVVNTPKPSTYSDEDFWNAFPPDEAEALPDEGDFYLEPD